MLLWLQGGGFRHWLISHITTELTYYNLCLKVASLDVHPWQLQADLENVEITTCDTHQPLLTTQHLYLKLTMQSLLGGKFALRELALQQPTVYVQFDEQGRPNFAQIKVAELRQQDIAQISTLSTSITGGQLVYGDKRVSFDGELNNLRFTMLMQPQAPVKISLVAAQSNLKYQDHPIVLESLILQAELSQKRAEIKALNVTSSLGDVAATGTITDWQSFNYQFNLKTKWNVQNILATFAPAHQASGELLVEGQLSGLQGDYQFQGQLAATKLTAPDLVINKMALNGNAATQAWQLWDYTQPYSFTGGLNFAQVQYKQFAINRLQAQLVGTDKQLTLNHLAGEVLGGQFQGTVQLSLNGGTSHLKAQALGVNIAEVLSQLLHQSSPLTGQSNADIELQWPGLNFLAHTGQLQAQFSAQTRTTQPQSVAIAGDLAANLAHSQLQLQTANIVTGATKINLAGSATLQALDLAVKMQSSDIAAARQVAEQVGLLPTTAEPLGLTDNSNPTLALAGETEFTGRLEGTPANPRLQGLLTVAQVISGTDQLGRFMGQVHYSVGDFALTDAALLQPNGGRADFDFRTGLTSGQETAAEVRLKHFNLSSIVIKPLQRLALQTGSLPGAYLSTVLKGLSGEANGQLILNGLPNGHDLVVKGGSSINLPRLRGQIDLQIDNTHPAAQFRQLNLQATLDDQQIKVSRLNIELMSGKLSGLGSYHTQTKDYQVELAGQNIDLEELAQHMGQRHDINMSGLASLDLKAQGHNGLPSFTLKLQGADFESGGNYAKNVDLVAQGQKDLATLTIQADFQGRRYPITGRVKLIDDLPLEAEIPINNSTILPFVSLFSPIPPRLDTSALGSFKISGPLATDDGLSVKKLKVIGEFSKLTLQVQPLEGEQVAYTVANEGPVMIEAGVNGLSFTSFNLKGEGTSVNVKGRLGVSSPGINLAGQVNLRLLNGFASAAFIQGQANFNAVVNNITDKGMSLTGSADLQKVTVRYPGIPLPIEEGKGKVLFTDGRALLENFVAKSGSGQLKIGGGVTLERLRPERFRLDIQASNLRLNYPQNVRSLVEGNFVLQGSPNLQVLSGSVNVRKAEYTDNTDLVTALALKSRVSLSPSDLGDFSHFALNTLTLDLNINAQDSLVVRNNIADLVGSATLKMTGSVSSPVFSGRATISRGTLTLRNDRYEISRGIVDFPTSRSSQPRFDVEANTDLKGYQIILSVLGTPNRFNTTLRSEPALPQSDIVTLLTTGQLPPPGSSLQSLESQTRIGTALSILTESLSERVEQRTGRLFGLNRFQIDPLLAGRGSDPTAKITIGRRITKNLSLTYSTNITTGQEQIVVIEYQVNRNISVIGTRDQDGSYGFDIRFRKRF